MGPDTFPAMGKIGGQYVNSQFAKMEALDHGFVEDAAKGAHYYGIPQGVHFSGIFYNKGMFEEAGSTSCAGS